MIHSFYGRNGRALVNVPAPYTDRHVSFAAWLEHAYRNIPAGSLGVPDSERTNEIYRALFAADRTATMPLEEWTAADGPFDDPLSAILAVNAQPHPHYQAHWPPPAQHPNPHLQT